jgi:hypothetical protein
MAARASVTLTDAATTPVNHVFSPVAKVGNVLVWQDRTATAIMIGQNRLTLSQRPAEKDAKTTKFVLKLDQPILEQTSPSTATGIQPVPVVGYRNLATVEFVLHERSAEQERKDLLSMIRDLLNETIVTNLVHTYDMIY